MSTVYPLDPLIKKIERANYSKNEWKRLQEDKTIIIIDVNKKEILKSIPFIKIGRDIRIYSVALDQMVEAGGVEVTIRDFEADQSITIEVEYAASCPMGNENILVQAIINQPNPVVALKRKIEKWIKAFAKKHEDFIQSYEKNSSKLKKNIVEKAFNELGLELIPKLKVKGDDQLVIEKIEADEISIFVDDYKEKIPLTYSAEIDIIAENSEGKMLALVGQNKQVERKKIIKNSIEQYMYTISLKKFVAELSTHVTQEITNEVNNKLKKHGRFLRKLILKAPLENIQIDSLRNFSPVITHNIEEYSGDILIKNKVQMILDDLGLFHSKNIKDLEKWVFNSLDTIIKEDLFDASYTDLVLKINDYRTSIRDRFIEKAKEIGYNVKILTVKPDLPPIRWYEDGFLIEDMGEKDFPTKNPDVPIRLEIIISGRIRSLEAISDFLNSRINMIDRIKEMTLRETAKIVHQIEPDVANLQFADHVEPVVFERIKSELIERYAISETDLSITIKKAETQLLKRYKTLSKGVRQARIVLKPKYQSGNREEVTYDLTYKIIGVHPHHWYTFQNNAMETIDEELEGVQKVFTEVVRSKLEFEPNSINEALTHAINMVAEATGLLIRPFGFNFDDTITMATRRKLYLEKVEERAKEEMENFKEELGHKKTQLRVLEKRLTQLLAAATDEDDEDEIEGIKKRIESIKKELNHPFESDPVEDFLPASATITNALLPESIRKALPESLNKSKDYDKDTD